MESIGLVLCSVEFNTYTYIVGSGGGPAATPLSGSSGRLAKVDLVGIEGNYEWGAAADHHRGRHGAVAGEAKFRLQRFAFEHAKPVQQQVPFRRGPGSPRG